MIDILDLLHLLTTGKKSLKHLLEEWFPSQHLLYWFCISTLYLELWLKNNDTAKNISLSVDDLIVDSNPIFLKDNLFMFGVSIQSGYKLLSDETYIKMRINQINVVKGNTSIKSIKFVNWSFDNFTNISKQLLQKMNINSYYWPESNDLYVLANSFADNFTYFEFTITRWSGTDSKGNPWKSDTEIDAAIDSSEIQLAMINNYFDFDDYNKSIKSYLDDQFYYPLTSGFSKFADINIRQNTGEQKDSLFRYQSTGSRFSFISIEPVDEKFSKIDSNNKILTISFYKDPKSVNYERTVFSFLDGWGLIGGVNEILEISGKLIVSLFSGKIFAFSILSALYQVDLINSTQRKETSNSNSNGKLRKSKTQRNKISNFHSLSVCIFTNSHFYLSSNVKY